MRFAWKAPAVVAALLLVGCRGAEKVTVPAAAAPPSTAGSRTSPNSTVTGKGPHADGGFPAIIVLEPKEPRDFPSPAEPKVMDQQGLAFTPHLLLVRRGQAVMFRNREDVLHNVRVGESATGESMFNVATIPGNSYTHTFERPGFYSVECDVHETMHADILVTSTPYAVIAGDDGVFTIADVPQGSYTLTAYLGARRIEQAVEVVGARTELIVSLE